MRYRATKIGYFAVFLLLLLCCGACTPIYRSNYTYRQSYRHHRIAVVPPLVERSDTTGRLRSPGDLSALYQGGLYDWLEQRRYQYGGDLLTQDTDATIDRLEAAGFYENSPLTNAEIAQLLEVDVLLLTELAVNDRPRFNLWRLRRVRRIDAKLQLYDRTSGRVIWEYIPTLYVGHRRPLLPALDRLAMRGSRYLPYYR